MTRGNQREIDRKRAENRAKAQGGSTKKTTKEQDAEALRLKQQAANARKEAAAGKK